jgi:phage-related protein
LTRAKALEAVQQLQRTGVQAGREVQQALDERVARRFAESLNAAESELRDIGQQARRTGAELQQNLRAAADGGGALSAAGAKIAAVWGAVGGVVAGVVTGAFQKLWESVKEGAEALSKQEALEAKLAALARARGLAAEETARALSEQAEQLKQQTAFDDDAIRAAQVTLLTYQQISTDALPRVTKAALDVAAALRSAGDTQVDLQSVARLLGRALEDPVAGMEALRRMGIVLDEQTKQYIKTLVEQGQVLQAQDVLLSKIEERVGGTAEAFAQSSAGIRELLKLTLGDLEKELGRVFLEVQRTLAPALTVAVRDLLPVVGDIANTIARAIAPVLQSLVPVVSQFFAAIGRALQSFVQGVLPALTTFAQAFAQLLAPVAGLVGSLAQTLANVLAPAISAILKVATPIAEVLAQVFNAILPELSAVLEEIGAIVGEL